MRQTHTYLFTFLAFPYHLIYRIIYPQELLSL